MPMKTRLSFSNFCSMVEKFWIPSKPEGDFSSTTKVSCACLCCSNVSVKKAVKFTEDAASGKSGCLHCFKVLSSTDEYKEKLKTRVTRRRLHKKIKKVTFPTRGKSFTFHNLSESTLKELFEIFCKASFLRSKCLPEMKGDKKAPRPDFCFYKERVVVEWDGPGHYTDPAVILRDRKNQKTYESFGYQVVRIPYFIELNDDMGAMGFDIINMITYSSYPHGFVRDGVVLPAEITIKI